jgi:hypothetical protein
MSDTNSNLDSDFEVGVYLFEDDRVLILYGFTPIESQ